MRMWSYPLTIVALGHSLLSNRVDVIPETVKLLTPLLIIILAVLLVTRFMWLERRHKKVAIKANYTLCLHCEYDLTGLKQKQKCPECGMQYDLDEVRKCWMCYRPLWPWPVTQE